MFKGLYLTTVLGLAITASLCTMHCGSAPDATDVQAREDASTADSALLADGGGAGTNDSGDDGAIPDTTVCAQGTYEFPFRSGTCIDDPCDPDPCGGTGTCSNVTGASVCTTCTYFVDATLGADTNDGKSVATPWKSLAKVNAAALGAGDNVCFKRGETFAGGIDVTRSGTAGNPLHYGNYGERTRGKPVIAGTVMVSGFTPQGTPGVWKAPCPTCGETVNVVLIGGVPQQVGRYPNRSAANGGYLTYEAVVGPATTDPNAFYGSPYAGALGIVDNDLPASPNWNGAEVVIRKTNYVMDRAVVTSHLGSTVQYQNPNAPSIHVGRPGWGYFFQNSLQTLDEVGEWYYDPAKKEVDVFFGAAGPGAAVVEASVVDSLVRMGAKTDVAIDGISLRGANGRAIDLNQSKNVAITSVDVRFSGKIGAYLSGTDGVTVRNCEVVHSGNTGISIQHASKNTTIVNNVVQYSGVVPGAGARLQDTDSPNHQGIAIGGGIVDQNALIDTNVVDRTGYNGIHFVASGVHVKNNLVTKFTTLLDDGGGIYTWRGSEVYVNRKITGNVVLDGPGSSAGKKDLTSFSSSCIYLDNATSNLEMTGNTMARCTRASLLWNYARDVQVKGNTAFDSPQQAEIWSLPSAPITNATCTDNIFFSRGDDQLVLNVSAATGQLQNFGTFDRNFYIRPSANDLIINSTLDGTIAKSHWLKSWQLAFGHDASSSVTPAILRSYGAPKLLSGNLVTGGDFETGISSVIVYSNNNNAVGKANGSAKLTGTGSLQIDPSSAVKQSSRIYTSGPGIGPISSTKTYLLRVSTLGTSENGVITGAIGQRGSPYADLAPAQKRAYGTKRVDHEFVFVNPKSDPAGTFSIGIEERAGTTYIDNIEVYEISAPVLNRDDSIRFEVNTRTAPKTVVLDGAYIDAKNASYNGSITLQPLSSVILMKTQ